MLFSSGLPVLGPEERRREETSCRQPDQRSAVLRGVRSGETEQLRYFETSKVSPWVLSWDRFCFYSVLHSETSMNVGHSGTKVNMGLFEHFASQCGSRLCDHRVKQHLCDFLFVFSRCGVQSEHQRALTRAWWPTPTAHHDTESSARSPTPRTSAATSTVLKGRPWTQGSAARSGRRRGRGLRGRG